MFKRYMHKRERYFAMLNDNRIVHPFGWGTEFIDGQTNGGDPQEIFRKYSADMVAASDDFFYLPEIADFSVEDGALTGMAKNDQAARPKTITWTSAVATPSAENNTARAQFFPHDKDKKAAVVVLPHWNARAGPPMAATLNAALSPATRVRLDGPVAVMLRLLPVRVTLLPR